MNYMSLCSGVEAISVAWKGLGFNPVAFSEIEKFPSAVLEHHYPNVPNFGDMTNYKEWKNDGTVNLIVAGTPCQSFSIAGLRKGLEDPRGNLMLTFGAIIKKYRPTWLLWENVPGVLSSNRGRDFGTFLAMLGQFGYGYAYRVLDAQFFGVAQRRRRVFVVGYLGDWRNPAKVLFEQESVRGDTQKGKKEKQGTAENSCNGSGASSKRVEIPKLAPTLTNSAAGLSRPGNASNEDSWYIPTFHGSLKARRLTPIEAERLQGFEDDYTRIPYRGKPKEQCPDGPRYKAMGNSMAVPVVKWIGQRIKMVNDDV